MSKGWISGAGPGRSRRVHGEIHGFEQGKRLLMKAGKPAFAWACNMQNRNIMRTQPGECAGYRVCQNTAVEWHAEAGLAGLLREVSRGQGAVIKRAADDDQGVVAALHVERGMRAVILVERGAAESSGPRG